MQLIQTEWAQVDEKGRLVLPVDVVQRFGLEPGAHLRLEDVKNGIKLHRPSTNLRKVYIEPTNLCNLVCRTCIRQSWDEPMGKMDESTFSSLLQGLSAISPKPSVFFGGLGEPLFHTRTIEWVARVKELDVYVELITNGVLLTEKRTQQLIDSGLDRLWVSIDGATPESYADVRLGAELPNILENMQRFRRMRPNKHTPRPEFGVVFVAMRRNIADLPQVITLGKRFGAKQFMVTNVLPYTQEMLAEVLFPRTLKNITYQPSPWLPYLQLPKMDVDDLTSEYLFEALNSGCNVELAGNNLGGSNDVCTFIESGSTTIGWDGNLSPCPPLLHTYLTFLHGKQRVSHRHVIGNLKDHSLLDLWLDADYIAYRERVQSFAFAPCTVCGGCDLSETNDGDCYGNVFPDCGGCLWAQGLIQCP